MCCNPNIVVKTMNEIKIDKDAEKDRDKTKEQKAPLRENLKNNVTSKVNTGMSQGNRLDTDFDTVIPIFKNRGDLFGNNKIKLSEYVVENPEDTLTTRIKNLSLIVDNAPRLKLEVYLFIKLGCEFFCSSTRIGSQN